MEKDGLDPAVHIHTHPIPIPFNPEAGDTLCNDSIDNDQDGDTDSDDSDC